MSVTASATSFVQRTQLAAGPTHEPVLVESQAETVVHAEQPIPLHDDGLDSHERSEVRFGCNVSDQR